MEPDKTIRELGKLIIVIWAATSLFFVIFAMGVISKLDKIVELLSK